MYFRILVYRSSFTEAQLFKKTVKNNHKPFNQSINNFIFYIALFVNFY